MNDVKPNLPAPIEGKYHRNEWAILGAPRLRAREIAFDIYSEMSGDINLLYMDNDHNTDKRVPISFAGEFRFRINYYNFAYRTEHVEGDYYGHFAPFDGILLSGNHYESDKQIVVINKVKRKALERRAEKLTNVVMFILDDQDEVFDFLYDIVDDAENIPVFNMDEPEQIAEYLKNEINENIPELNGLVMDMGGETDFPELMKALDRSCDESFVVGEGAYDGIKNWECDFRNMGPIGLVLSAFKNRPDCAFLAVASDVKSLDKNVVDELNSYRNPKKIATCLMNEDDGSPEPLFTIWEPRAYPQIMKFLARGYSDVRYILKNSDCEMVKSPNIKKIKRK